MLFSVGILVTAMIAQSPQQPSAAPPPTATITRAATPPKLEDFLTGERRDGLVADAFLQREPQDLVPSTERTEAYLSYDASNLYVVLVCHAKDPSKVRARMNRREQIFNDDFVGALQQQSDRVTEAAEDWPSSDYPKVVTKRQPTPEEWTALRFAW